MQDNQPTPKSYNFFFLWIIVAAVYVVHGLYLQFYVVNRDTSEAILQYALAVTWLCIGWTFSYTSTTKK